MRESVIYQDIQETSEAKGIQKGIKQGIKQGIQKGEVKLVIRLLNRKFGEISPHLTQTIRQLSVEQLENLGEALLNFQTEEDLTNWLDSQS